MLMGFLSLTATAAAQSTPDPLPDDLKANFTPATYAAIIHPSTNLADIDRLWATVRFQTVAQELRFQWLARADGAKPKVVDEVYSVSYQPTDVCVRAGRGPDLFVAGYVERTGDVIIERWTVDDIALGSAIPQGGGAAVSTLAKTIRRSVVTITDEIGPIRTIAFHAPLGCLFALEAGSPYRLWKILPDTGAAVFAFDYNYMPQLALTKEITSMMVDDTAPDGGGFLFLFDPWTPWDMVAWHYHGIEDDDLVHMWRDSNLDGVTDEALNIEMGELSNRGYYIHEDPYYLESLE